MTAENSTSVKECSSLLEYIGTHWHRELRSESAVNIGMKMWEMWYGTRETVSMKVNWHGLVLGKLHTNHVETSTSGTAVNYQS